MKPKYQTRWIANIAIGTYVLSSSAFALDNLWTGAVDNDWNKAANWSDPHTPPFGAPHVPTNGEGHPGDEDAVINTLNNFPVLLVNPSATPRDIKIGAAGGSTGRLDVRSGIAAAGGSNWMVVGDAGGNGTLNVANTDIPTPGNLSGFAPGEGGTVSGQLRIGTGGGTGVANINTSGTLAHGSDLVVGDGNNSVGTFNLDSGTVTTGGWNFVGRGAGSQGFFNVSGGTLTNTGRFYLGENGTATAVQTGGTVTNGGETRIGQGTTGVATYTISGGTFTANNWFLIGREGSNGTLNLSGSGTVIKNGAEPFAISNDPGAGSGTFNQSGGTITTATGSTMFIGNVAGRPGLWNLSGGVANIGGQIQVGAAGDGTLTMTGGTITAPGNVVVAQEATGNGTLSLGGGTLTTGRISGGAGADSTTFNGTQIVASSPLDPFIQNLDVATIGSGGLKVDTNGFNVAIPQVFSGTGGVVKSGSGTLTLTGASTLSGTNSVIAGKLVLPASAIITGDADVAANATLGVIQTGPDEVLSLVNVSFGAVGSNLDVNLGNFDGNPANAPLDVSGNLTLSGNVTINLTDQLPAVGTIPLVSYAGAKSGPGIFVLGTLPNGVQGTLSDVGGVVSLNVTSVALPYWDATVNAIWDTTTTNWIDLVSGEPSVYSNGEPVLFNDFVTGVTQGAVILNQTVTPESVTFNNLGVPYTLTGTGKISGDTGLIKGGGETVTISTVNDYTGVTTLEGGTTSVGQLANGGSPSGIGAASAAPANLVLSGGTLEYTGAAIAIDRGFTVTAANSGISTQNDLNLSGAITSTGGNFFKRGSGNLTLSNSGTKTLGAVGQNSQIVGGTLTLVGPGTTEVPGELWIGSTPNVPANLVLNGGTLNVGSWIAQGRGNGDSGTLSTLTATNSVINSINFSTGFDNGQPNDSDQTVTLTNTTWTNTGRVALAESANSLTNMVIGGTSSFVSGDRFNMGIGVGSVANLIVQDSGSLNKTGGWFSVGDSNNGIGTLIVRNNATVSANNDFNISDGGTSQGTITLEDSAVVNSTGTFFLGKNAGTVGTAQLDGGTLNVVRVRGGAGNSNLNFNGGVLRALPGADANFIDLVSTITVQAGGGTIDTNGVNLTIGQSFGDGTGGGGIAKIGAGTLTLNGNHSFTGPMNVNAGTLAGSGSVAGPLVIASTATLAPGNAIGTFAADSAAINGTLAIAVNGPIADVLAVNGLLDLSSLTDTLAITTPGSGASQVAYVIANYTSLSGTFNTVTGLPSGYSIDYNYQEGNQIAVVRPQTPFDLFIGEFYPFDTDPAIIGPAADPDNDGQSNFVEFALGGDPSSGSDGPKVYHLIADSSDAGELDELLLTIAVLDGTPALTGSPSPTATHNGATYSIQGSLNLATFSNSVTAVDPVTDGLPTAPEGYTYRTFRLDESDGTPGKGFLRVRVTF